MTMAAKNSWMTKTTKMKVIASIISLIYRTVSLRFVGPFDSKEGDYEVDDEMYDTEGMFDDYMGLDGKQDDDGMLDNTRDNNSEL